MFDILTNKKKKSLQYFCRSKSDIVPLLLKEISPERVTIMEELGRGAFGKVHKGILKEMPKVEVFFKPKEERVDFNEGRVVAVKILHSKYKLIYSVFVTLRMQHEHLLSCSKLTLLNRSVWLSLPTAFFSFFCMKLTTVEPLIDTHTQTICLRNKGSE